MSAARKRTSQEWSGSDRIGKLSSFGLRDLIVQVRIGHITTVRDEILHALGRLEDILDLVHEQENDKCIVVEELVDIIKRLEEERVTAIDERKDAEIEHEKELASVKEAQTNARKDHEEDAATMAQTINDLRKRAELAEHQLDQQASERAAALAREVSRLTDENEELTKALEHARKQTPMRTRVKRVK